MKNKTAELLMKLNLIPEFQWERHSEKKEWVCTQVSWVLSEGTNKHVLKTIKHPEGISESEILKAKDILWNFNEE